MELSLKQGVEFGFTVGPFEALNLFRKFEKLSLRIKSRSYG